MSRSEPERTLIVRAWLAQGSTELSRRVHDEVLREFPRITQDGPHWSPGRAWVGAYVAAAAAIVVFAVIAGIRFLPAAVPGVAGPTAVPSPSETPRATPTPADRSYREAGFIGLPPPGAPPSGGLTTELIDSWFLPTSYDGIRDASGPGYLGAAMMYADGRLIWNEYFAGGSTGWLEQRLTSEGLELVPTFALADPPDAFKRLDYIRLPEQLPASAWADITVRPYVPSGFAACLFVHDPEVADYEPPTTLTVKLALLPGAARDILDDRPLVPATGYGEPHGALLDCLSLDTVDARRLDAALRDAGLEQEGPRNRFLLEYHIDLDGKRPGTTQLGIWFEPILPDGTITCSSCG